MNIAAVDDAADVLVRIGPYVVGWCCGWLLLWRTRPLPRADGRHRPSVAVTVPALDEADSITDVQHRRSVAVIVPARDEADSITDVLAPLVRSARPGDEIVVVDDHSTDGTGELAAALGVRVVPAPDLPDGWLGKPHACATGASATTAPVLVFVDADVRPPGDLLDRIGAAVDHRPDAVVSVQPWHVPGRPSEQLSVLFNVTAMMGVGAFALGGSGTSSRAAFGPVLALDRDTYERVGGHARHDVRRSHTEDIALARAVGTAELHGGRPDVAFRMYPGGLADLVRGWTRSIATGAWSAPLWSTLATVAWVASLAGGWLVEPWLYLVSAVQLWVLARRAGRFAPWVVALFPLALAVFVVVVVRSLVLLVTRRDVRWKGRSVPSR